MAAPSSSSPGSPVADPVATTFSFSARPGSTRRSTCPSCRFHAATPIGCRRSPTGSTTPAPGASRSACALGLGLAADFLIGDDPPGARRSATRCATSSAAGGTAVAGTQRSVLLYVVPAADARPSTKAWLAQREQHNTRTCAPATSTCRSWTSAATSSPSSTACRSPRLGPNTAAEGRRLATTWSSCRRPCPTPITVMRGNVARAARLVRASRRLPRPGHEAETREAESLERRAGEGEDIPRGQDARVSSALPGRAAARPGGRQQRRGRRVRLRVPVRQPARRAWSDASASNVAGAARLHGHRHFHESRS